MHIRVYAVSMFLWTGFSRSPCTYFANSIQSMLQNAKVVPLITFRPQFITNIVWQACEPKFHERFTVCEDGQLHFSARCFVKVNVVIDVHDFPFDSHKVVLYFGDVLRSNQVMLKHFNFNGHENISIIRGVEPNGVWMLESGTCVPHVFHVYMDHPFITDVQVIKCEHVISRLAGYYILNFCVPTVIVVLTAVLGIRHSGKALNSESKMFHIAVATLMSLSVLILGISDQIPSTGQLSLLHIFFFCLLLDVAFCPVHMLLLAKCRIRYDGNKPVTQVINTCDMLMFLFEFALPIVLLAWFCMKI